MHDPDRSSRNIIPTLQQRLISRERLLHMLHQAHDRKLTVLSAPAGFGKTTLVATWLQTLPTNEVQVAWVALDSNDNDLVHFWQRLLAALARCNPDIAHEALATLLTAGASAPIEYVLTQLINRIATSSTRYLLVIDDYHLIVEPSIHRSLHLLLQHIPPQLNLVVLSRTEPPLPLADLRARGQALEVRAEQLRCTRTEIETFLTDVMGVRLTPAWLDEVQHSTEGWLLGLQLLGLSLQGTSDPTTTLTALRASTHPASAFLIEHVFQRQLPAMQTFLLKTSILDSLCAPLCDVLMETSNSQQLLEQLTQANLFLVALDGQRHWYRYHQLFADALRERLEREQPEQTRSLYQRASNWYALNGHLDAAINHALHAEAWETAADLIEQLPYVFTWANGFNESARQHRWLHQLPEAVLQARPRLCFIYARSIYVSASTAQIEHWLQRAESVDSTDNPTPEITNMLGEIAGYRAYLDMSRGDGQRTVSLCQTALPLLAANNFTARADVLFTMAVTNIYEGHGATGAQTLLDAADLIYRTGDVWSAVLWRSLAGAWQAFQGHLHVAWQTLEQAAQLAQEPYGHPLPISAYTLCFQADILREWNRLDEALALIRQAYTFTELINSPHFAMIAQPVLARILRTRGDLAGAYAAIQQLDQVPAHWSRARALYAVVDQVQIWLAVGAVDRINTAMKTFRTQRDSMRLPREYEDLAQIYVLLTQQQPAKARKLLRPLINSAHRQGRISQSIEGLILTALAAQQQSHQTAALAALTTALRLAEPQGYIRRFVDAGEPIQRLLIRLQAQQLEPTPYIDRLLAVFAAQTMVE
jgi:LuxR family maltose regulon positive regulatory protein